MLCVAAVSLVLFTTSGAYAQSCAAPGRDGPVTIPLQPNTYYAGAGSASGSSLTLGALDARGSGTPFAAGDMALVVQMQDGATTTFTPDGPGYGAGAAGGRAGQYEYAVVASATGASLTFAQPLVNVYSQSPATQQSFQVVRVPQYSSATLAGVISPPAWNGATGGILAIDVAGVLTFAGSIDASGRGFRGGASLQATGDGATPAIDRYRFPSTLGWGGSKGEGIAGTPRRTWTALLGAADTGAPDRYPNGDHGRGAPGTAGGGGTDGNPQLNDQNSGGGGGGNGGAGGRGGNSWFSNLPFGGLGGSAFPAGPGRVVLGGGGGAGTTNNEGGLTVSGAAGGGAVFVRAGAVAGAGTINVDGAAAPTAAPICCDDGAGGGGAGGSAVIFAAVPTGLAGITVTARGGKGGDTNGTTEAHGPGGGGGGGAIFANGLLGGAVVTPGVHGVTATASLTPGTSIFPAEYGSVDGSPGVVTLGAATNGPGAQPGALCLPALTVTKSTVPTGPVNVAPGSNVTWRITVANAAGRGAATGVSISDTLPGTPSPFTNQSAAPVVTLNGGATRPTTANAPVGATTPAWSSFSIPGGGSVLLEFVANIPPTTASGTYQNPAVATWLDPQRTTATGTTTASYVPTTSTAEDVVVGSGQSIDIVKSAGAVATVSPTVFDVPYTLRFRNTGTTPLANVQVNEYLGIGPGSTFPTASAVTIQVAPTRASLSPAESCPAGIVINPAFTGLLADTRLLTGTGTLAPGEGCAVTFTARVTYASAAAVPTTVQNNTAYASATAPAAPSSPSLPNAGYTFGGPAPVPPAAATALDTSTNSATLPTAPNGDTPAPTPIGFNGVTPAAVGALSGAVWLDLTRNRARDPGEAGIPGFGVEVISTTTGTLVACSAGVNTTLGCITMPDGRSLFRTDANGNYNVTTLADGEYAVRFRDGTTNVSFGIPVNGSNDPNARLDTATRDRLIVRIAGAPMLNQSLPLDPSGVVYDSASRLPVTGATVTFCGPVGAFTTAAPLTSALVGAGYAAIPGAPQCASMPTGATGAYQFLLNDTAPTGQYSIAVTAPSYTSPSTRIPPAVGALTPGAGTAPFLVQPQTGPPQGTDPTTYYLLLNLVAGGAAVLHNHVPLDPRTGAALGLEKVASRPTVELGDALDYTLILRNPDVAAPGTIITDRLPRGFALLAGSLRLNGVLQPDPPGAPGPVLSIPVGTVPAGGQVTLTYRVRVGIGASEGEAVNRAQAASTSGLASNQAEAKVRVLGGAFTREACVIGKVFVDCNGNSVQDREELGIPGVRLYFSDGTWVVSDSEGKYGYCGLPPKLHALKVDRTTLPRGSRLTTSSNRNALDPNSLFLDLKAGELHQADFIEGSCSDPVLRQVKARRAKGEVSAPETERQGSPALIFRKGNTPLEGNQPAPLPRYVDPPPAVCRNEADCRPLDAVDLRNESQMRGGAR